MLSLSDISFDEQDANLFQVENPRLRADALKHSVLPRLQVLMSEANSRIYKTFNIDVFDDSIISVFPNFRQKRDHELKHLYEEAFVSLGGARKAKWTGFSRKDGKPVTVLPFRFGFALDKKGVYLVFENGWLKGLTDQSFEKLLNFHMEHEKTITPMCFYSNMKPTILCGPGLSCFSPMSEQYACRIKHRLYDNHFLGRVHPYPLTEDDLYSLVDFYEAFFPVYDSYIQIAKGLPPRLIELTQRLNDDLCKEAEDFEENETDIKEEKEGANAEVVRQAEIAAEKKIRVMPAIRWRVFLRDQWKCVSCGRSSHDGIILHVDHIVPRSLGGSDSLENYQTLCNDCNIGKSNRDATDLRRPK